jgi:hypothetical protein
MSIKKSSDTIGKRTRDLPVFSAVPQPLRHCIYSTLANQKLLPRLNKFSNIYHSISGIFGFVARKIIIKNN